MGVAVVKPVKNKAEYITAWWMAKVRLAELKQQKLSTSQAFVPELVSVSSNSVTDLISDSMAVQSDSTEALMTPAAFTDRKVALTDEIDAGTPEILTSYLNIIPDSSSSSSSNSNKGPTDVYRPSSGLVSWSAAGHVSPVSQGAGGATYLVIVGAVNLVTDLGHVGRYSSYTVR